MDFFHRKKSKSRYVCVLWKAVSFKLKGDIGIAVYCLFIVRMKYILGRVFAWLQTDYPGKVRTATACVTLKLLDQNICMHRYFNFIIAVFSIMVSGPCYVYKTCPVLYHQHDHDNRIYNAMNQLHGNCFCPSYTLFNWLKFTNFLHVGAYDGADRIRKHRFPESNKYNILNSNIKHSWPYLLLNCSYL